VTRTGLAVFAAVLMVLPGAAIAGHVPEQVASEDPDGAHTMKLLVEDHQGGEYEYIEVDANANKATLADLIASTGNPQLQTVAEQLRATDSPVNEVGVYTQQWERDGSPMLTVGVYEIDNEQERVRVPLVIFENIRDRGHLANEVVTLMLDEGPDVVTPSIPFLLEATLVELSDRSFEEYPNDSNVDTYEDQPTVYAWYVRRAEAGQSVWQGLYLDRTGDHGGQNEGTGTYDAQRRMEVGTATRVNGDTTHVAGVYATSQVHREGQPDQQRSEYSITVGATSEEAGDVPLATVNATDERRDDENQLYTTPDEQRTRFTLGTWVDGRYVPLLGAQTEATHRHYKCPDQPDRQPAPQDECIEQERETNLGVYVDGEYRPMTGMRYHGERFPLSTWPLVWLAGGGPGAQNSGDVELETGVYTHGEFQPVAGAHYDDAFEHAEYTYQGMISAGVYADGYQPLVATTYDGGRPFLEFLDNVVQDDRSQAEPWMASAGTFAGEDYAPLVGARYRPTAVDGDRQHQHQVSAGVFLADYRFFVPVAGAQWDGEQGPTQYTLDWATQGTLGAQTGDWEANAGTFVLDTYQPLIGVRNSEDYASTTGEKSNEQQTVVGVYGPDNAFVPVAGVTYTSNAALVDSTNTFADPSDDDPFRATAGVFVQGEFVPLAGVHNGPSGTQTTVLPQDY
jgi:hypothetical protein